MSKKEKPLFEHDCNECVFLGLFMSKKYEASIFDHRNYDLYFCNQGGLFTVIARYGNDGHSYISGLPFAKHGVVKPLCVARSLAIEKKLMTWNDA